MPSMQCENGKWKWGETGSCKYESKQEADQDNVDYERKISFDYDGTLTSSDGLRKFNTERKSGKEIFIISAREKDGDLLEFAKNNGIKEENVFATGSIERKIQKIKELRISTHYDNDSQVIEKLDGIGVLIGKVKRKKMENIKRHVKEIIEDDETITIIYEKDENFEGIKVKESDTPDEGPEKDVDDEYEDDEEKDDEEKQFNSLSKSNIWNKKSELEKRYYDIQLEKRKDSGKTTPVIVGHAAVFGQLSEDLGGFQERISNTAFDDVLDNDVRAFFNHDPNHLLARTSSGTLKLSVDEKGLKYEFSVPDTSSGRDLLVSMDRGDITQSSFAFTVEDDSWEERDGIDIRTINKVKRLYDVSPVSIPAYPDANDLSVAQRSLAINKEQQTRKDEEKDLIRRNLLELNIKILKRK